MNIKNVRCQTSKQATWTDEAGNEVPFKLLKKSEVKNEKLMYQVVKEAIAASERLAKLKRFIAEKVQEAVNNFHHDYEGKRTAFKGNYTFFLFDYSAKVIVKVASPIQFDDLTINRAKELLDDFLADGITAKDAALKQLVMDAFQTSRGKMDVKKILGLRRYADRIADKRYKQAMELIDKAIRRPTSCTYYQVWVRNAQGQFEAVKLSLSDV